MRPDEYAVLRKRAGFDDPDGSRRIGRLTQFMDALGARQFGWRTKFLFSAACIGAVLWLYPVLVVDKVQPSRGVVPLLWGGSLVVVLAAWLVYRRQGVRPTSLGDKDARRRARYAEDLWARQVDEWRLRLVEAVDIDVDEGVGTEFYLELDDGRVLFVSEDDLWNAEYDEDDVVRFPTWEVILTRLPHADEMLSLHAVGEQLYTSATWPGFPDPEYQTGPIPPRGTFLPGPIWRYESLHTDDGDWDED
jgi:hypothetical protein